MTLGDDEHRYRHSKSLFPSPDDIDHLGHVSNLVYLRWVLGAALDHSEAVGLTESAYRELGATFMVRRHQLDYLRPVRASDKIQITTWVKSSTAAASKRATSIYIVAATTGASATSYTNEHTLVATAETLWVWVDLASGRPRRIPPKIIELFCQPPL